MTGNEYQALAQRTSNTQSWMDKLQNGVMGLCGEAGETIDIVKKFRFQGHKMFDREHILEEIGDVMWYCAETVTALDANLDDVMAANIEKLKKRYPQGFDSDRSEHRDS